MSRKLLIRDLTIRDGQQSAFATRMTQAQIDRVLPYYKEVGFYAIESWGGAVPDSIMRFLGENPWDRLEKIHAVIGDVSKLTALSRGRNLFGYAPYPDNIIEGFCRNSIQSGLGIMRIFDALNDINNVKSTIKYVKQYGGIADCAVCYTIDPRFTKMERFKAFLKGKPLPKEVFTDEYFLKKAKEMEANGADMITIKDMSGLIEPTRVGNLVALFKKNLKIPVDFHTHCTPGYGLGAMLSAIVNGVDIVDTVIWNFAGGPAAPALELIYVFCKKMGIDLGINMEAVAKINADLLDIRKELELQDTGRVWFLSGVLFFLIPLLFLGLIYVDTQWLPVSVIRFTLLFTGVGCLGAFGLGAWYGDRKTRRNCLIFMAVMIPLLVYLVYSYFANGYFS